MPCLITLTADTALAKKAAKAQTAVRLVYSRAGQAQACPDEAAVRRAVVALLQADPFREPAELVIGAALTSEAGGLKARLEVKTAGDEPRGGREIVSEASDCTELAAAMELAISIAINPFLLGPKRLEPAPPPARPAAKAVPPRPAPAKEAPPAKDAPAPVEPAPPAGPPPPVDFEAQLALLASLGTAPDIAFGASLGFAVRFSRFQVGIEGRGDLPASRAAGAGQVDAALFIGSLVPCVRISLVGVCVLASGGAVRASARGLPGSREAFAPYSGLGARVFVDLTLKGPVALRFQGELRAATTRATLEAGSEAVWTMPIVSGGVALAGVVHFP